MSQAPTIHVLCSDRGHHSWPALEKWAEKNGAEITDEKSVLTGGDLLLLVSCTEFVEPEVRAKYRSVYVIHESALPEGRGWSPLAWQVLEGRKEFTASLITATDEIDAGNLVAQAQFDLEGHELSDEINSVRDSVRTTLMSVAAQNIGATGRPQSGTPTKYRRRTPEDSRLDPEKSIAEQFDLLRICEERFPAFFEHRGHRYEVTLTKTEAATMVSRTERAALEAFVAANYSGSGEIVEIGAFLGGSALAILEGMSKAGATTKLHVYDTFRFPSNDLEPAFRKLAPQCKGESFREVFDRNTEKHAQRIEVHEGDASKAVWPGGAIEFMHIDCSISLEFHRAVAMEFYPKLMADAVLAHQDHGYTRAPFIAEMMSQLEPWFKSFQQIETTRYFRCVNVPTREELEQVFELAEAIAA